MTFRLVLGCFGICGLLGFATDASAATLTYRSGHSLFTIESNAYPSWKLPRERWFYEGKAIAPIPEMLVEGDAPIALPEKITRVSLPSWDLVAIAATLRQRIATPFYRAPHDVTIRKTATGGIVFDGIGMLGRTVNLQRAATLTVQALESGQTEIELPVEELQPTVTVEDPTLREQGIREIVMIGESDFTNSPVNRRHNIATGLSKFNGTLIPKDAVFSFNTVLGKVGPQTGYRKELVILGDHTLPDYGGGLCQVSTTAYRGAWEEGFPIMQRRNHSYVVSYYSPPGSDATIYPPARDMRFTNDGPGALLIQTHREGNRAYFIYYGTRDTRKSLLLGPYMSNFREPPPDREEVTTEIAPGERRKVGDRHAGMNVLWLRIITSPDGSEKVERFFSGYEARPLFHQVGVEAGEIPVLENNL
jgi:vancomycin resistance protein YoaR